jgi:hypothetical protein
LLNKEIHGKQVKRWLDITDFEINLANLCNPPLRQWTNYFGIDLCGKDLKITDFNSDRATIIGFQQEIAEIFEKYYPEEKIEKFYNLLIPLIQEITFKRNPKVFVLIYKNEPYLPAIKNFAKRFGFKIGSIDEFPKEKFDLILRQVKSEEIINNLKTYDPLIRQLYDGVPMINPLGSYISGHKGWMTIICALNLMPKSWFPSSWLINGENALDSNGDFHSTKDIIENFSKENLDKSKSRKNYVLKKGFGAGGGQVFIGADLKNHQWKEIWETVHASKTTWVVEERLSRNEKEIYVGDTNKNCNIDSLNVYKDRINLIERIYSAGNYTRFCGEVFGKRANKVNASGYTFPLTFTK